MNIIRNRTDEDDEDMEDSSETTGNSTLAGKETRTTDKEVYNSEKTFVLYLEIIFTSPECSTKLLESHGIDSMAPENKPGGILWGGVKKLFFFIFFILVSQPSE